MAEEVVRVVYQLGGIREAQQGAEGLAGALDHSEQSAQRSASAFSSLTSTLTGYLGLRAIAGDALAAGRALLGLSSEAEDTRIAIAGMLQAGGAAGLSGSAQDFSRYMGVSAEVMAKIRKDARELPGEAEDLMNVFRGSLQGGLEAGKSVMDIEGLSARMMAVSKVLQIPSEVAGREMQMMMEGRAGAHNALWQRLKANIGVTAEEFNAFSSAEKWDRIDKALKGYDPAIKEFAKTWSAVSSTAADYVKTLLRVGGEPIFNALRDILLEITGYYEQHQAQIDEMVKSLGGELADELRATWGYAKEVMAWIIDHRDDIAKVLEMAAIYKIGTGLASLGAAGGGAAGGVAGAVIGVGGAFMGAQLLQEAQQIGQQDKLDAAWNGGITSMDAAMQGAHRINRSKADQEELGASTPEMLELQQDIAKGVLEQTKAVADLAKQLGPTGNSQTAVESYMRSIGISEDDNAFHRAGQLAAMINAYQVASSVTAPASSSGGLASKPTTSHHTTNNITNHNRFETKIDAADNPDRVYVDLKRAVRDAQLFPKESATSGSGVLR